MENKNICVIEYNGCNIMNETFPIAVFVNAHKYKTEKNRYSSVQFQRREYIFQLTKKM